MSSSIWSTTCRRLSLGAGLVCLAVCLWALPRALAQSEDGCPSGPRCIYAGNFDATVDGWQTDRVSLEWLDNKTLGLSSSAQGLLHISNISPDPNRSSLEVAGIYKTFYLQPGQYNIIFRAGQDMSLLVNGIYLRVSSSGADSWMVSGHLSAWYYSVLETGQFVIHNPETVRVYIGPEAPAYIDYIWIERLADNYPTPTPFGVTVTPGGPTATPRPTPIPTNQQATPAPTGSAVCNDATPTPTGIPAYATATTPTATPANRLSRLETFDQSTAIDLSSLWSRLGQVRMDMSDDHTGNGGMSALIPYDPHGSISSASTFDSALILATGFGYPVWVNLWAKADVVPIGQTAYIEIWQEVGGTWTLQGAVPISAIWWYPAHAAIDAEATHIAFVSRRTDMSTAPTVGSIDIDDVYLYAPESNKPFCGGGYPPGASSMSGDSLAGAGSTTLWWPADRPCPTLADVPNNFWGPILKGLTLFMLQEFAWSPLHPSGWMTTMAQNTLMSPIGIMFTFTAILFDWTVPITILKIYLGWQGIYYLILVWRIIRYSTVQ